MHKKIKKKKLVSQLVAKYYLEFVSQKEKVYSDTVITNLQTI